MVLDGEDSLEALEEFKANPEKFDLLVTDQAMPKMMGTELIEQLKQIKPDLKSIIITGYLDLIPKEAIEQYGIADVISKPLVLGEFSESISKALTEMDIKKM